MLNLFDKKTKNNCSDLSKLNFFSATAKDISNNDNASGLKKNNIGETRHYLAATKEWFNSIYSYNKNFIKTLPVVDKMVNKLIKSYFNLSPLYKNKKSKRIQVRFKRLSLNRILVSRAEMKHTNNKVIITVYLYNKNKKFFLYKLKDLYKTFIFKARKIPSLKVVNGPGKGQTNNTYITAKKSLSKFSSKRFKKSNNKITANKANHSLNFTNLTKKNLSLFISNIAPNNTEGFALKDKYKSLINKYYFLLSSNKLNTISNKNFFSNFVNLAKPKSSLNKETSFSTKRNNSYFRLLDENKANNYITFESVFALNKPSSRVGRNMKNFISNLRNLHKLFFISKMYSGSPFNKTSDVTLTLTNQENNSCTLKKRNFLLKNLHNILKNKSTFLKKINTISLKGLKILKKARRNKNFLLKTLKWNNKNSAFALNYETKYYKNFIKKSYRKEILYLYYVKMLSLNNNKFKNWFILGLKKIISKIYNKKVEFNFVNLKYLHLNSDLFSQSIAIKLRNRQNRLLKVLKKALKLVKLPALNKLSFYDKKAHKKFINKYETLNLNSYISMLKDKDILHELLYKIFPRYTNKIDSPVYSQSKDNASALQENILNSTKHKNIYGVRLEAAGRLSRRLTASRSVFKLKYKGSLKNIDSSYKNISTVMLRGNTKSNIQLTKISSKTRNGAFGLKGWISSN